MNERPQRVSIQWILKRENRSRAGWIKATLFLVSMPARPQAVRSFECPLDIHPTGSFTHASLHLRRKKSENCFPLENSFEDSQA